MADGMDDAWALFDGPSGPPPVAPVVPPLSSKRPRLDDALEPFLDADGRVIEINRPPTPRALSEEAAAAALAVWPAHPPHFIGPLELRDGAPPPEGCGRGFVAARDLLPGDLLMAEAPFVEWPAAERSPLAMLRALLSTHTGAARAELLGKDQIAFASDTACIMKISW